jgi:hypothetical protein
MLALLLFVADVALRRLDLEAIFGHQRNTSRRATRLL